MIVSKGGRRSGWIAALLLLLAALALRAQTFGNPVIGYDEQFYLVVGDRMLHGGIPFVDIFDRKPVGLFLIYAFIRLLGGDGTIQYQFVALIFAVATALVIRRFALRLTNPFGALLAGIAYLVWLSFLEGEGGQAPVLFNLPMALAALLTARLVERGSITARSAALPMLLVGLAMQIKYTALFEGIFFGLALLDRARRERPDAAHLARLAATWIVIALAPTLAAWLVYVAIGQGPAFVFANFVSMFGKFGDPWQVSAEGLLTIGAILLPILACVAFPPASIAADVEFAERHRFVRLWLLAATVGMLIMRSFPSPHYAMPLLTPALIAAAPRLGQRGRSRQLIVIMLALAAIISQVVLRSLRDMKGGATEAAEIARAADPGPKGCLYIYDGYAALYRLTHSCLLSRYVFPGHLNMANESNPAALGVDPAAEVRRILARRPETIVLDDPPFDRGNRTTYAIVRAELVRHYRLTLSVATGERHRLVYRRIRDRKSVV